MISLLSKFLIKNNKDYSSPAVRSAYGTLCGICGIFFNVALFVMKLLVGFFTGSVAVTADAFNNLSDAGSSVITLIGFRLASQKPDEDHPFGHGRFEYISGLVVSMIILLMGFELVKSSVDKIMHPADVQINTVSIVILTISVAVKLYMAIYNRSIGKKINSSAMTATAVDSISDSLATTVVMISMLISHFYGIKIDGYCGLAVALFIIYAGINAAKETINPLLGQPPSREFVDEIHTIVMSYPEIKGIHDLIVHDYGPGRVMVSLHAEVSESANLLETHDIIDNIEKYLSEKLECSAVIHMDPIADNDAETSEMKETVAGFVSDCFGKDVTIHDFRMVRGNTHTNIIFDIVVPYTCNLSDAEIKEKVRIYLESFEKRYFAVITIDRSYIY